jgi:hypothetical protein
MLHFVIQEKEKTLPLLIPPSAAASTAAAAEGTFIARHWLECTVAIRFCFSICFGGFG